MCQQCQERCNREHQGAAFAHFLQVSKCKQLVKLAALSALTAATDPKGTAKLARLVARVPGGRGRGRCGQPLFSPGVDRQVGAETP